MTKLVLALAPLVLLACDRERPPRSEGLTTAVRDEIVFTGLIAWAQIPAKDAYWAILPDADCDSDGSPSPPGTGFCMTAKDIFAHEPYLLFYNAKFTSHDFLNLEPQDIYVNVNNSVGDVGANLSGISLKGAKIDFNLSQTLSKVELGRLVSANDIPQTGWGFKVDANIWTTDPGGDNKDYLQAVAVVDSGDELISARVPSLDCQEQIQATKIYGMVGGSVCCGESKARFYAEDVFLYSSSGAISFAMDSKNYTVERVDASLPLKIYVLNVRPAAWRMLGGIPARECTEHHHAFRWFYGLTSDPKAGDTMNHFTPCDHPSVDNLAADRRCPQAYLD